MIKLPFSPDDVGRHFFELASPNRLEQLQLLNENNCRIVDIAKKTGNPRQYVDRNIKRLLTKGWIESDSSRNYKLSLRGELSLYSLSYIWFFLNNDSYWKKHECRMLPQKFLERLSVFNNSEIIPNSMKIFELWDTMFKRAKQSISVILIDTGYTSAHLDILTHKLKENVKIRTIFSEDTEFKNAKNLLTTKKIRVLSDEGLITQKIKKDNGIALILTENEAGVCFPFKDLDEIDYNKMFYSKDETFIEWVQDYFAYMWNLE